MSSWASRADARLAVPEGIKGAPLVVYVHGGFFKSEWTRDNTSTHRLLGQLPKTHATLDLEYARVDQREPAASVGGGGWPHSNLDVLAGLNSAISFSDNHNLDLSRVYLVGHSAGGTLALWLGLLSRLSSAERASLAEAVRSEAGDEAAAALAAGVDARVRVVGVAAIAPVADLRVAASSGYSDFHDAVPNYFWRCGPHEGALDSACPTALLRRLPSLGGADDSGGLRMLLIHGLSDVDVPPCESTRFASAVWSRAHVHPLWLHLVPDADHLELVGITEVAHREGGSDRWAAAAHLIGALVSDDEAVLSAGAYTSAADAAALTQSAPTPVCVQRTVARIESGELRADHGVELSRGLSRWLEWRRVTPEDSNGETGEALVQAVTRYLASVS